MQEQPSKYHGGVYGPLLFPRTVIPTVKLNQYKSRKELKEGLNKWRPRVTSRAVKLTTDRGVSHGTFQWPSLKTHSGEGPKQDHRGIHDPWIPWRNVIVAVTGPDKSVLTWLWLILNILFWIILGHFWILWWIIWRYTRRNEKKLELEISDSDYCLRWDIVPFDLETIKWLLIYWLFL